MQRIIQINIAGRVIPIEEDAYHILKDYMSALSRQFSGADGAEIIEDIEARIAELFSIRLESGAQAIDRNDVKKVTEMLGAPGDLNDGSSYRAGTGQTYGSYTKFTYSTAPRRDRLFRDPFNKVIGGVCSGLAHYFDVDPVIIRLIMVVLFFSFGVGLLAYIIAWAIIPAARSVEELRYGTPMTFHDISYNMGVELEDLKKRGEQMSRDLKDFFSKKK